MSMTTFHIPAGYTLSSKRKQLRTAQRQLVQLEALSKPTASQRVKMVTLSYDIARLKLSIKAWS